jgi:hypothetical protein
VKTLFSICLLLLTLLQPACNAAEEGMLNGALHYRQAMRLLPQLSKSECSALNNVKDLSSLKNLPPELIEKLEQSMMQGFFQHLMSARECQKCIFLPPIGETLKLDQATNEPFHIFCVFINALGWRAMAAEKPGLAVNMFLSILMIADGLEINADLKQSLIYGIEIRRLALESLNVCLKQTSDPEARKMALDFLLSRSRPLFNIQQAIAREYQKLLEFIILLEKEPRYLADFFSAEKLESENIKKCRVFRMVIQKSIEMAQLDGYLIDSETDFSVVQNELIDRGYLKLELECPDSGQFHLEYRPDGMIQQVNCTCEGESVDESSPAHLDPARVKKALAYKDSTRYIADRKEVLEYFNHLKELDFTQDDPFFSMPDEYDYERLKYSNNVLLANFMIDHRTLLHKTQQLQKLVDSLTE